MRVFVHDLYGGTSKEVDGSPEAVEQELIRCYPWLHRPDPADRGGVAGIVELLNAEQGFEAEVDDGGESGPPPQGLAKSDRDDLGVVQAMLGHRPAWEASLEAASFLSGRQPAETRRALLEADGDRDRASLASVGLEPSPANLEALRAVREATASRSATTGDPEPPRQVEPGHPDARDAADAVRRAFQDRFVMPVHLPGRHSKGTLLARDEETGDTYLLKPGSGGQSPAAGDREDPADQSRREVAFWHVADAWQMGSSYPRADLLLVDGRDVAAIKLLPWDYRGLDEVEEESPAAGRRVLAPYLASGALHRWAVLDAVLGNPDGHAGNLMVRARDGDVKLIDHGSSFAGRGFDPAHDQDSFTPYYLRAWAPAGFRDLPEEEQLRSMPRSPRSVEEDLRGWLGGLRGEDLDRVLLRYGVDPAPCRERLAKLEVLAAQYPVDEAVNRFWVET